MRTAVIALTGICGSYAAFGLSDLFTGLASAALFLLGCLLAPLAFGIAIADVVARREVQGGMAGRTPRWKRRFRRHHVAELTRCSGCGGQRELSGTILVCRRCDHAPVAS